MPRETVETIDGRIFYSDDGWATVTLSRHGKTLEIGGRQADLARFLAVCQGEERKAAPAKLWPAGANTEGD
jgi:hypothetical protein